MLKRLYEWALAKVSGPSGVWWLGGMSFADSSFFPIPPDVLMMPMILADHTRAWRLAFITTVTSVVGAVFGYLIGAFLYDLIAAPLLAFYGYQEVFEGFGDYYLEYGVLIVLIGGLTPMPFKVITIASGVFGLNPLLFFVCAVASRGPRFYLEAALLWRFGPPIKAFIDKYLAWVVTSVVLVGALGFLSLKWL